MSEERNNDMDIRDVLQTNDTAIEAVDLVKDCLLYTSPSPRD